MTRILPKGPVKPAMPENITFRGTQEPRRRQPSLVSEPYVIALGHSGPASRVAQMDREAARDAIATRRGIAFGFVLGVLAWLGVWVFADFCVWLARVTR